MTDRSSDDPIRLVIAADTPGHTIGYHVVSRGLVDAGFDVVLAGYATPSEIVEIAIQDGVDVVAYRIMDGHPEMLVERLMERMRERDCAGLPVIVGGIIPDEIVPELKRLGVGAVFTPGTRIEDIANYLSEQCTSGR